MVCKQEGRKYHLNISEIPSRTDFEKGTFDPDKRIDITETDISEEKGFDPDQRIEVEPYDEVFDEIWDWDEDDIPIDFDIDDDLQHALEDFQSDNWNDMSEADRMSAAEYVKDLVSENLGLENAPELKLYDGEEGDFGAFDPESNTIVLNSKYLNDPVETLDTITHELRHAYQHYRADINETDEDAMYKKNFEWYIPAQLSETGYVSFMDYYGQYVEADARAFADYFKEALNYGQYNKDFL